MLYEVFKMSTAFSDAGIRYFPRVCSNAVNSSCVMETVHQTRYCRFVWHSRIGKCIPNAILTC
jgi:nitrate reductase beta subunit